MPADQVNFILDDFNRNKLFGIPHEPLMVLKANNIGLRFFSLY